MPNAADSTAPRLEWEVAIRPDLAPVPVPFALSLHPDLLDFAERFALAQRLCLRDVLSEALTSGLQMEWSLLAHDEREGDPDGRAYDSLDFDDDIPF